MIKATCQRVPLNRRISTPDGGDLEVTIEESDGTQRRFIQPYSSLPMMQRPGHLKYIATAGRYRADANGIARNPQFLARRCLV
ncbi:fimbria/pilus outer membrane usher protein [Escherichia coli]